MSIGVKISVSTLLQHQIRGDSRLLCLMLATTLLNQPSLSPSLLSALLTCIKCPNSSTADGSKAVGGSAVVLHSTSIGIGAVLLSDAGEYVGPVGCNKRGVFLTTTEPERTEEKCKTEQSVCATDIV